MLQGVTRLLHGVTKLLNGVTRCYSVLQGVTRLLQGVQGCHTVSQGGTHQHCVAKICNSSSRAHANTFYNDPFTISVFTMARGFGDVPTHQIWKCEVANMCISFFRGDIYVAARLLRSLRSIHHFLPECIAFNQSALRHFLPECIGPQTTQECHTVEPNPFFAWIPVRNFSGYVLL